MQQCVYTLCSRRFLPSTVRLRGYSKKDSCTEIQFLTLASLSTTQKKQPLTGRKLSTSDVMKHLSRIVALAERPRISSVGISLLVFQFGPERKCQERSSESSLRCFSPNMRKDEEGLKTENRTDFGLGQFLSGVNSKMCWRARSFCLTSIKGFQEIYSLPLI